MHQRINHRIVGPPSPWAATSEARQAPLESPALPDHSHAPNRAWPKVTLHGRCHSRLAEGTPLTSEQDPDTDLYLARWSSRTDRAEIRGSERRAGVPEVRVVERVEKFAANPGADALRNTKIP